MATDITVPLSFTTLPVITITEITPLAFGDVLSLTQADTCSIDTASGTVLTSAQEGANLTATGPYTTPPGPRSAGAITGTTCTGSGQVGIYEITSYADADITVSVTAGTPTEISFAPAGYVTNLVEGGAGTSRVDLDGIGVNASASLALSAFAAAGTNRAVVGGTITNQTRLTAGAAYTTDFNLNVIYQ